MAKYKYNLTVDNEDNATILTLPHEGKTKRERANTKPQKVVVYGLSNRELEIYKNITVNIPSRKLHELRWERLKAFFKLVFLIQKTKRQLNMNIKNIIRSQRVRHLLMKSCAWLPDRIMLPLQYYMLLHRWPDLKHPKRFTEWIQYYKMHYRNPDMLRCVDKYAVRSYVEEKGCSRYLNELYQVCEDATEIDFDKLPQKFVIKTTNGGGGDNVLVVKDKDSLDIGATIQKVNSWLKRIIPTHRANGLTQDLPQIQESS